jgi:hypothetical protein
MAAWFEHDWLYGFVSAWRFIVSKTAVLFSVATKYLEKKATNFNVENIMILYMQFSEISFETFGILAV